MIAKIHTSKKTQKIFDEIKASENLKPYILAKLAISLSLKTGKPLEDHDFKTDNDGIELNRQVITGDFDLLYKCLIEKFEGCYMNDDDYFSKYIKAHLDRGSSLLYSEFRYGSDLMTQLLNG